MNLGEICFSEQSSNEVTTTPVAEQKPVKKRVSKAKQKDNSAENLVEAPAQEKPVYKTYEDYFYTELLTYAGIDTYGTSKIVSKIFPKLVERPDYRVKEGKSGVAIKKAPALIEVYESCTQVIFDFICDLELAGISYSVEANRALDKSMQEEIKELEDRIFTKLGRRVHLDSSDAMSTLLYSELGFKAPHQTKSGADAVDGAALLTLAGLDPLSPGKYVTTDPDLQFLADIAKRKNLASVHRGFISTYIDDYLQPDGRIHALYNQFGTSTFRLSSSEPNLNTLGFMPAMVCRNVT